MSSNKIKASYRIFLAGYLLFYLFIRFSFSLQAGPTAAGPANWLFTGILGLGSAFLPYYILRKYYASSTAPGIALRLLFGLAVAFLLHLLAAKLILSISFNQFIDTSYQLLINLSFYGIGFYFIRYSYLKRVQTKESEIRERERLITVYQQAFPKEQVFGQLAKIEEMIQHNPPAALKEIEGFCDELQQMIYSIPNARNE